MITMASVIDTLTNTTCPSENTAEVDQSGFWNPDGGITWDKHRIGWAIAGGCAALTTLVTLVGVSLHASHYRVPAEQRQIIRIYYLPMVYAIISFFSYRFFRDYTYYSLIEVAYEALTISAFLLLIIQYVASTSSDRKAESALARKEKRGLPIPFCCIRYRPTKPAFMYTLKWTVLQYAVVRPAVSIAGIITQALGVLCEGTWSVHFAGVWLSAIDFVSITFALYGLIVFYTLTREELKGRRPLAKFIAIKGIVFFTFYQSFVFDILQKHGGIHASEYWSESNIVDGLNALATTIEMVIFSFYVLWAYPFTEYRDPSLGKRKNFVKALWDSINYADFVWEIYTSLKFFVLYIIGRPETRVQKDKDERGRVDFEEAFLRDRSSSSYNPPRFDDSRGLVQRNGGATSMDRTTSPATATEEEYVTSPQVYGMGDRIPMSNLQNGRR